MLKQKVGDKITVLAFTGMNLGQFEITKATNKTITVTNAKGADMVFDRATGVQTNAKNERYANKAVNAQEEPSHGKPAKKAPAKATKAATASKTKAKAKPAAAEADEDEDEAEAEKPAKTAKPAKKKEAAPAKPAKKASKTPPPEEADDEDDYEDYDDEDEDDYEDA